MSRTKPKPYCAYCDKNQTNLEKHLVRKQNYKNKALRMSSWNSGHKNRPLKANNECKTKDHVLTPLISPIPIPDYHKEPVRLDNYLRSTPQSIA